MRIIIAGSRFAPEDHGAPARYAAACEEAMATLRLIIEVDVVISGAARGADRIGEEWGRRHGVPVKRMPAEWGTFGKRAGFMRNESMAKLPGVGALLALWDGKSKGTKHMIGLARERKLLVWVQPVN